MKNQTTKSNKVFNWVFLFIILGVVVFLNIIGTFIYSRIDMTEDERHSLSGGTITFLEKMNPEDAAGNNKEDKVGRLYIKIYLEGKLQLRSSVFEMQWKTN
jgi:hypothetical protein